MAGPSLVVVVFMLHVNRRERGFSSEPLWEEKKGGREEEEEEEERERERESKEVLVESLINTTKSLCTGT